jgi:uncharacterized protein YbcI
MATKSKQEIESAVSSHLSKFLKEQMGEQVKTLTAQLLEDTIIVRLKNLLSPAERCLIKDWEGLKLIKELKTKLMEGSKDNLETLIKDLIGVEVVDIHTSFNTEYSELVIVFSMAKNLEKAF